MKVKINLTGHFFIMAALFIFAVACNAEQESMDVQEAAKNANVHGVSIDISNNTLSFHNEDELNKVVEIMKNKRSVSTKRTQDYQSIEIFDGENDFSMEGFTSLYDIFNTAMEEAESYYERIGGYEEFKLKYNTLYFPEYGDDYSAYLPVSDKYLAKLVNKDGEIIIAGKTVCFMDITNYQQLIEMGIAPKEENDDMELQNLAYPINKLPETKCKDRKIWVNTHVRAGSFPGVSQEIVIEVCFRRKGILGVWYNYSSETRMAWEGAGYASKSGFSSHDYLIPRQWYNGNPLPVQGLMWVGLRHCNFDKNYFMVNL